MSTQQKVSRLEQFLRENRALENVPAMTVAGRPTTLREALNYLRAGTYASEVVSGLQSLGLDPPPWELCQEFYRRLVAARSDVRVVTLGFVPPMSPSEALAHIERRDDVGRTLVSAYANLLNFLRSRIDS